ncbi:hypothetical protein OG422_31300 (plasmid) [Streptomyces sp. NBC_01525]|uniref:hypothetical protein n=1 Tax=Streptomyces sp. NBC_01525 TaxID=2903893 RepID=UPI0038671AAF
MTSAPSPARTGLPAVAPTAPASAARLRRMLDGLDGDVRALTVHQPYATAIALAGHHHWTLTGAWPLPEPVPARGQLGLWRPKADALEAVHRQLAAALAATGTTPARPVPSPTT